MKQLTEGDIRTLRSAGKVLDCESVTLEGDVIVAVNVQTGERRVVDASTLMLECKRQLLCD